MTPAAYSPAAPSRRNFPPPDPPPPGAAGITVLAADDEPDILQILSYNLSREGFRVITCADGAEAVELARRETPDLVLLDIMMPGMNGMEACRAMRALPSMHDKLIVFLTARSEEYYQVEGFGVGADDFICKPIRPRVLLSRIRALLRRLAAAGGHGVLRTGTLAIDHEKYLVHRHGKALSLPRKEFELLSLLASRPGKIFTREDILRTIWGKGVVVGDRTIDVHVRKLRIKLGDGVIKTAKGIGYKYEIVG
jgi:two-component system alkaline phosphatase synthesis response regulator PhoP